MLDGSAGDGSIATDGRVPDLDGSIRDAGDSDAADGSADAGADAGGIAPAPDGTDSVLYSPENAQTLLAYARVIRIAHTQAQRGVLLASFEHSHSDGTPSAYVIRQSDDDGITWSTRSSVQDGEIGPGHPAAIFYQPALFELPEQMGTHPKGTLLLAGNVLSRPNSGVEYQARFGLWRSDDVGLTWTFVSVFQVGEAQQGRGIWEPFLDVDGQGRLVCYFADERRSANHSQIISRIVSTDGGDSWSADVDGNTLTAPGLVVDVQSGVQGDRPGMPTVATLPDGARLMAYEVCGTALGTCEIRVKKSTDGGATWGSGAADLGDLVITTDGRYATNSPYIVYSPSGQILLSSMRARRVSDDSYAPEDWQMVFVNEQEGDGEWSWIPAPQPVFNDPINSPCYMNYSPHLLVSAGGASIRYTAASQDADHPCAERTATANAGVLPYASTFEQGRAGGFKVYSGCYSIEDGIYSDSCGGVGEESKALAGSTAWTDYRLEGDVRIDTAGANAGFMLRFSDAQSGIDAHRGYYVGIGDTLFLGRQSYNYTSLASTPIVGGVAAGEFFHVTAEVVGCAFSLSVRPADSADAPTTLSHTDPGCAIAAGAVGVRNFGGNASFRAITVEAL